MSLTMAITLMLGAWLLAAAAMLWGVLRISRHHRRAPHRPAATPAENAAAPSKAPRRTAGAQ
ncbi:hypothetical protein [Pseudomonas typographi]|nr:hypothetical protein [Pseudomonas typographi]